MPMETTVPTETVTKVIEVVEQMDYTEYLVKLVNSNELILDAVHVLSGFALFAIVVCLCYFCYKFFRIFFSTTRQGKQQAAHDQKAEYFFRHFQTGLSQRRISFYHPASVFFLFSPNIGRENRRIHQPRHRRHFTVSDRHFSVPIPFRYMRDSPKWSCPADPALSYRF